MQLTVQDAFVLASKHDAAGRRAEARAIYEQILAALPEHPGALLKIAEQELHAGLHDEARARLERALRAAQQQSLPAHEIWLVLGRVHLGRGDRAAATGSSANSRLMQATHRSRSAAFARRRIASHGTPQRRQVWHWRCAPRATSTRLR